MNSSLAVEGKATVTFSCDDATGAYKVALANVQVIGSDHKSPWTAFVVSWALNSPDKAHFVTASVQLTQNSTTGLFKGKQSGTLADVKTCVTGATLDVISSGSTNQHDLYLLGSLT